MNISEFIAKWKRNTRSERAASQEHFLDLCSLLGHPTPNQDATGENFAFERGVTRRGKRVGQGWADVWKRGYFGWEYKGKHKDLIAALDQLKQYKDDLENPPLLIVCDMQRLEIHTNFTGTKPEKHYVDLNALDQPSQLEKLRWTFFEPQRFHPQETVQEITERAARKLGQLATQMRDRGLDAFQVARFLDRVVFCLFAEDIGLLPEGIFSRLVTAQRYNPERLAQLMENLFRCMALGEPFGADFIRRFNGNLFNDEPVLLLTHSEIEVVREACGYDWASLNPSIMGTLFERGLDETKRSQLGAHYTGQADIETLVYPVVIEPLLREWNEIRERVETLLEDEDKNKKAAREAVDGFLQRLGAIRVLDPACGSGNFLYVTLQKLKDLEKLANRFAADHDLGGFETYVRPEQFIGIEVNPYAVDLAQTTLWIGFLQWTRANGYEFPPDPVLHATDNFKCMDAILDRSDAENPREAQWPSVDFIVGNPPFLGGSLLWRELGREYQQDLWRVWKNRVPGGADLCCYWFEKARQQIADGNCKRAGLLATQGIRGKANREVLKNIKETGDIFFAESDRPWVLDGANVRVSMVGFDNGSETKRVLDKHKVSVINANLSGAADVTQAQKLKENINISFIGTKKAGDFNIPEEVALHLLPMPNPHSKPNSDVVRPWTNGSAIVQRPAPEWIIDAGTSMSEDEFNQYEAPFHHVLARVKPQRDKNNRAIRRNRWWLHAETAPNMRVNVRNLQRCIVTSGYQNTAYLLGCQQLSCLITRFSFLHETTITSLAYSIRDCTKYGL